MRTISLIFAIVICFILQGNKPVIENGSTPNPCSDCGEYENMTIDEVLALGFEGSDEWTEKYGLADGTYYEAIVVFGDDTRGRLFKGGNSGKYFIENPSGSNFYYINLRAAIRALYLYKKYACISSKFRL